MEDTCTTASFQLKKAIRPQLMTGMTKSAMAGSEESRLNTVLVILL